MPAIDSCQPNVIKAFEKEGWQVIEQPLMLRLMKRNIYIDIKFRRLKGGIVEEIVIAEVKCFSNPKFDLEEFYSAIGQYQLYRKALHIYNDFSDIYLVIPQTAYQRLQLESALIAIFEETDVKLILVDVEQEVILQWIIWQPS